MKSNEVKVSVSFRYSDLIWRQRQKCIYHECGRLPDNVMIHPKHKDAIYDEVVNSCSITTNKGKLTHFFGMLVVWTDHIGDDDVICTYNGR